MTQLFDRRLFKQRRSRCVATPTAQTFYQRISDQLRQRLTFFSGFERGLVIGPFPLSVAATTFQADCIATTRPALVMDEELFPFAQKSLDIIVSFMGLHAVNDLPGTLSQFNQALRPKGLFLAAFVGEESLLELRHCFWEAELQQNQGVSPHVMPLLTLQDAGALLQRAHFKRPVVDKDRLTLDFPCLEDLATFLRATGLTNVLQNRNKRPLCRSLLYTVKKLYQQQHPTALGGITATFDILYMTGVSEI
jgi:NADH dehydrogenase [ubiquinone] 1 alpha subcomplex assembly factor 5